jgi:hypothetical protein
MGAASLTATALKNGADSNPLLRVEDRPVSMGKPWPRALLKKGNGPRTAENSPAAVVLEGRSIAAAERFGQGRS